MNRSILRRGAQKKEWKIDITSPPLSQPPLVRVQSIDETAAERRQYDLEEKRLLDEYAEYMDAYVGEIRKYLHKYGLSVDTGSMGRSPVTGAPGCIPGV